MSQPTQRDILDYKGLLLTRKFNPFFWRNLYEETGGDEYWMKKENGKFTKGDGTKHLPDNHPVLKEFADYKKKLGLEGFDAIREIFKGKENLRRLGYTAVKGDVKDRFAQVFLDYDSLSESVKQSVKPVAQKAISSYLRNRYFNLGLEDPKYSKFSEETGKVEVPASSAYKRYLDKRKILSDKLNELGFDVKEEKDVEDTYDEDLKELGKLQQLQETLLAETPAETETETPTEIPAAAPAPTGMEEGDLQKIITDVMTEMGDMPLNPDTRNEMIQKMYDKINNSNFKNQEELQNNLDTILAENENWPIGPAPAPAPAGAGKLRGMGGETDPQAPAPAEPAGGGEEEKEETNPAINPSNTATDFASQSTAPSDTMEETERKQMEQEDPKVLVGKSSSPATPQQNVPEPQDKPVPTQPTNENDPIKPPDLGGLEGEKNKTPSVSMDITKDRINIGEKVDDIPTETILDKIPESRFSSQFKTIKQLNDDIKYFIKNFGNVVGKDLIKQYNEADKTNLELIRRLHGLIGGKLKTDNQKEKKVGIIIDADEYINQKINDALLNRGVSMNVPAGVRTNLESEAVKEDKSIGNFDVRKAREGGLLAVRREPVYRYIPSNNEAMNKPVDSRRQIKNGGLRMLPTQRRDLSMTARKQVRDDPFARKHNPRKLICLY